MTRKPKTIEFWEGRLPHWEVEEGRYFVTIHLAGAIPAAGQRRIRAISGEFKSAPTTAARLQAQRRIFAEMEVWLDQAKYAPHFKNEQVARIAVEAIEHRVNHGVWRMFEYVVMPSHVHLFFELLQGSLKDVLEQFKSWTGSQAGRLLGVHGERFWQKEWFDHWSRSDEEDERIVQYIRHNPVKAGLVDDYRKWPYGSWHVTGTQRKNKIAATSRGAGPAGPSGPTP
jgi:REP element-mobilizing transposase RayT